MVVCAHGDVSKFCEKYDMRILEKYSGEIREYKGNCAVLVTDQKMPREEYDSLKCELFGRHVELVSTEWTDDEVMLRLLHNQIDQRGKRGGRQPFGYYQKHGRIVEIPAKMEVARRVIRLRDAGYTLQKIQEDSEIHHPDGGALSRSTVQQIIKNRNLYE